MRKPTKPLPTDYPLSRELAFLQRLWQLNHAMERLSLRMEKRLGVTAQQRLVLRCLGKFPGLTPGQLAILLHVDPSTVSSSLNRLQSRGLIERRRDPRDGRRASLGLTSKGRSLDPPASGTVESAVEHLLGSASDEAIASMIDILAQLTRLIDEESSV